jgi:hypothetical protein
MLHFGGLGNKSSVRATVAIAPEKLRSRQLSNLIRLTSG